MPSITGSSPSVALADHAAQPQHPVFLSIMFALSRGTTLKLRYNPAPMNSATDLKEFLDAARNQGASEETLVALLRGREWPEQDVYRVLADHFENRTGIQIPSYKRSSSAKDAFLYLFCFSTLATWTLGLGSILFTLIERWFPDPLVPTYYYRGAYYQMADALACVIIAFPVYLWVTRSILRELRHSAASLHPRCGSRLNSFWLALRSLRRYMPWADPPLPS